MTGLATELLYAGRPRRVAAGVRTEALLESIGDPDLTVGLGSYAFANWFNSGEFGEILQVVADRHRAAGGDPAKELPSASGHLLAIGFGFAALPDGGVPAGATISTRP